MVPHRKYAPAITLDRLQLLLQPGLLLIEYRTAEIAVEPDHPPVTYLSAEPRPVGRTRAEVVQEIIRRALDVVMVTRDGVGSWEKLPSRRGVTGLERGPTSHWIICVANNEDHRIGRDHFRGARRSAFLWSALAIGDVAGGVRKYTTPGDWRNTRRNTQQQRCNSPAQRDHRIFRERPQ